MFRVRSRVGNVGPHSQLIIGAIPGGLSPDGPPGTTVYACFSGIGGAELTLGFTGYDSFGNTAPSLHEGVTIRRERGMHKLAADRRDQRRARSDHLRRRLHRSHGQSGWRQWSGTPYSWSGPGGATSVQTRTACAAGTYTVTITDANLNTATASVTVTVNPLPTVTVNSATIASGGSATLTATTTASNPTYLWIPGNATTASITVSPTTTTTTTPP